LGYKKLCLIFRQILSVFKLEASLALLAERAKKAVFKMPHFSYEATEHQWSSERGDWAIAGYHGVNSEATNQAVLNDSHDFLGMETLMTRRTVLGQARLFECGKMGFGAATESLTRVR
jgi:hypothetical protein